MTRNLTFIPARTGARRSHMVDHHWRGGVYGEPRADGSHYASICEVEDPELGYMFAAAPDLLAALANLMAMVDSGIIKGDGKHDIETQARAAIAKAVGATTDQWEIAGRRAGWRTGDVPGQLVKNVAGASIPNVFKGDWKELCLNQGIKTEGRTNG